MRRFNATAFAQGARPWLQETKAEFLARTRDFLSAHKKAL